MAGVYYSSGTNSTFFTTCCKVAICDDQQKCPRCNYDVSPFYAGMPAEDRDACGTHRTMMSRTSEASRK